uniref:Uncharacterized protein n=1 Tax=Cacopsylla melanoneura TaxID=428564 RepID=A0A8D9ELC9_9HEMI
MKGRRHSAQHSNVEDIMCFVFRVFLLLLFFILYPSFLLFLLFMFFLIFFFFLSMIRCLSYLIPTLLGEFCREFLEETHPVKIKDNIRDKMIEENLKKRNAV